MVTREECKEMVSRPGKFEGSPVYAPYFFDLIMDGAGGDDVYYDGYERCHDIFKIDPSDMALFPELGEVYAVDCFADYNGFFYCTPVTEPEVDNVLEAEFDNE